MIVEGDVRPHFDNLKRLEENVKPLCAAPCELFHAVSVAVLNSRGENLCRICLGCWEELPFCTCRHQCRVDAGSLTACTQRYDEQPPTCCSSSKRVLVCDPVLHHGLRHESEAHWRWDNRPSTYIPGCSYCAF